MPSGPSSVSASCSTTVPGRTRNRMVSRDIRQSPFHAQHVADGAYFVGSSGWEYPDYFAGPGVVPTVEWGFDRGEPFERTREEHLNLRENVGAMDLSVMSNFLVQGRDAEAVMNRVCANNVAVPVGRVVYTQWLNDAAGIIADVTVTRQAEDRVLGHRRRQHSPSHSVVDQAEHSRRRVRDGHRRDERLGHAVGPGPEITRTAAGDQPQRLVERGIPVPHGAKGRTRAIPRCGRCA